jgi:hypothetical protein
MKGKHIMSHPYDNLISQLKAGTNQIPSKALLKSDETLRKILAPLPKKPVKKKPRAKAR